VEQLSEVELKKSMTRAGITYVYQGAKRTLGEVGCGKELRDWVGELKEGLGCRRSEDGYGRGLYLYGPYGDEALMLTARAAILHGVGAYVTSMSDYFGEGLDRFMKCLPTIQDGMLVCIRGYTMSASVKQAGPSEWHACAERAITRVIESGFPVVVSGEGRLEAGKDWWSRALTEKVASACVQTECKRAS